MSNDHVKAYIGSLAVLSAALAAAWTYWYGIPLDARSLVAAGIFALLILFGDLFSIRVNERFSVGAWDVALIAAVAIVGPVWAAAATLPSAVYVGRKDPWRIAYEAGHGLVITFLAGIVFSFVSVPLLHAPDGASLAPVFYGTLLAGTALLAANELINSVLMRLKYGQDFYETWSKSWQPYLLSDLVNVLTAGASVLTFLVYGPLAAVIVVAGCVGSQALVYRSREQVKEIASLRARVGSLEDALTNSNTTFGLMMIWDLGRKDGYTHHHAAATAVYAADIAREMKLEEGRAERLRMAGLLHNIGMFSLPDELLLSTGRLNSIGRRELNEHPERGERILATVPEFKEMASWVRWHHERVDGRGYPDRLRGSWLPVEAKILAVAQAYAAMVLDDPRRPAREPEEARRELVSGIDAQFDGLVVRALLRILDTETEGYRRADDDRFVFPSPDRTGAQAQHPAPRQSTAGTSA